MTEQLQTTSQTKATQAQELTPDELEHVAGGHTGGINVVLGDGSVRVIDAADYGVWQTRFGSGR